MRKIKKIDRLNRKQYRKDVREGRISGLYRELSFFEEVHYQKQSDI